MQRPLYHKSLMTSFYATFKSFQIRYIYLQAHTVQDKNISLSLSLSLIIIDVH